MTKQTRLATIMGGAVLVSALLTGCTGADGPKPDGSRSSPSDSGPTGSAAPELKDRSSEILANPPTLKAIATTKARASSSFRGSTFTIYGLTRTETASILTYSVTGGTGHSSPTDSLPQAWEKSPALVTPTHIYRVVTFQEEGKEWAAVANPTYRVDPGKESGPLQMLYPTLPKATTSVTLIGPWFEDVAVPVTDQTTG